MSCTKHGLDCPHTQVPQPKQPNVNYQVLKEICNNLSLNNKFCLFVASEKNQNISILLKKYNSAGEFIGTYTKYPAFKNYYTIGMHDVLNCNIHGLTAKLKRLGKQLSDSRLKINGRLK